MSKKLTKQQVEHRKFIKSAVWAAIREQVFNERGRLCENCGFDRYLQVHHLTYDRFGGEELMEDLQILCRKCHSEVHEIKVNPAVKKGTLNFYRKIAVEKGMLKSGGRGWKSLACKIAEHNRSVLPKTTKHGYKRYVRINLNKYA